MRFSRHRHRLPALVLGMVVGGAALWLVGRFPDVSPAAPVVSAVPARVDPVRVVNFESVEPLAVAPTVADGQGGKVFELSAAESLQFSTLCDLQMAAAEMDLDLTTKQWQAFAAAVVQAQAVRHSYEAQIAKAIAIGPGRYRIEIPAYANAGDELRRQFLVDLERGLGAEAAQEVIQKFARRFEGSFAGFGVSSQTLEIKGDVATAPDKLEVVRTARYWDSVEGRDRVMTRHEVHFPADEDPSGERWSALLALVSTAS